MKLTKAQIEIICFEVGFILNINDVKLHLITLYDYAGQLYTLLRTDDFFINEELLRTLTELQKLMYTKFRLEVNFKIVEEKIFCSLKAKFDLREGGSNSVHLELFSITK